ncbi:MAG: hypothetical protein OEL53_04460 [Rhodospirillales bacterium]|nr:hypothetical protein [Rhodospirillales bacterium]
MTNIIPNESITKPRIDESGLCSWLGKADPGEALEYHRGFLAIDIYRDAGRVPETIRRELGRVARRAGWAAEQGLVHLVQRRHGADDYSYLLIARPRPRGQRVSLQELLADQTAS